jgi:hypothetical protein
MDAPLPSSQTTTPTRTPSFTFISNAYSLASKRISILSWLVVDGARVKSLPVGLVGLSRDNQGLVEDPAANQMQDVMALWDVVCSSVWLKNTSLVSDLFVPDGSECSLRLF